MSDESLDEARWSFAKMRATVEAAQIAIELSFNASTLKELHSAAETIESLCSQLGGVSAPVRH